jgi:hypothetical protein
MQTKRGWWAFNGTSQRVSRGLEAVISRATIDEEFCLVLFADPDVGLTGYELTDDEVAALKAVDAESLDACAGEVGRRVLLRLSKSNADSVNRI